jgi:hypothetical protein
MITRGSIELLGLVLILMVGCAPGVDSGATSTPPSSADSAATAQAFLRAWETQDSTQMTALLTADAQEALAFGGGTAAWLAKRSTLYGPPLPGRGRVTPGSVAGDIASAEVAAVFACPRCQTPPPTWAPAPSYVSTVQLTLQRQPDGHWLITYFR